MNAIAAMLHSVVRARSYLANGSLDGADPRGLVQICYLRSHDPGVMDRRKLGVLEVNVRDILLVPATS